MKLNEAYLIVAADNFSPKFDFNEFVKFHNKNNSSATIALHKLADKTKVSQFGVAVVEKNGASKETLLYSNCFKTDPKLQFNERLLLVGKEVQIFLLLHIRTLQ